MKLTVLCDNNTFIDSYLIGEPAFSLYIESGDDKILFDVGYSNVYAFNAEKRNINLDSVNSIVLSHGHDDHTHGLKWHKFDKKTNLYYHDGCFEKKKIDEIDLTAPFSETEMNEKFSLKKVQNCTQISENLYIIAQIPRKMDFERDNPRLKTYVRGRWIQDKVLDETALVYKSKNGLVILTACSHSGVCNICEYAKSLFNEKIYAVIGGFHLFDVNEQVKRTIEYFKSEKIEKLYPCHCTSLFVKAEMINAGLPVFEVGSGLELEF